MPNRIHRSRALPVDLYGDEAVHEIELAEMWHRDWVFATPVDAVAEPGQYVALTIGRQPVVVVRGQDHRLRALANVCSHRGAPVVVECSGAASRFSCPYHGWAYDTEGALISVPYARTNEVPQGELALRSYEVTTWHGLVFVSLDANPEPFSERVATIEPYVRPLGIDRLFHDVAGTRRQTWRANWKIVYGNAIDAYRNFRVHPETVEPFSPTDAAYYLAGSARSSVTGGESAERADHLVVAVPPSFVAVIHADAMLWMRVVPTGVGATEVTLGVAGEQRVESPATIPGWDEAFIDEDRVICERLQRNGPARWQPGPLLDIERALGDFHEYLAWKLTGKPPEPPVVTARPGARPDPLD